MLLSQLLLLLLLLLRLYLCLHLWRSRHLPLLLQGLRGPAERSSSLKLHPLAGLTARRMTGVGPGG